MLPIVRSGAGIWLRAKYARIVEADTSSAVATSSVVHQSVGRSLLVTVLVRIQG